MSAANTATPCADSCSASSCRVLVLPVPVAPATRPWRLSMPRGMRIRASESRSASTHEAAELERRTLERVAGGDLGDPRVLGRCSWTAPRAACSCADPSAGLPDLMLATVIFKRVGDGRPYPDHGLSPRDWAALPPRQVRLDELVTTKDTPAAGRPARRGLDVLRRPVRARRGVAGRPVPRGRAAPGAAGRAPAAPRAARPRPRGRRLSGARPSPHHRGHPPGAASASWSPAGSTASTRCFKPLPGDTSKRDRGLQHHEREEGSADPRPPGAGQRLQRRHPLRAGRRDAGRARASGGFRKGEAGNAPGGGQGQAGAGVDDPAQRRRCPAGGPAVRQRPRSLRRHRPRAGRRRAWWATGFDKLAKREAGAGGEARRPPPACRRGRRRARPRLTRASCRALRPVEPVRRAGRGSRPHAAASSVASRCLRGVTTSSVVAAPQHGALLGHQRPPVADDERDRRPAPGAAARRPRRRASASGW